MKKIALSGKSSGIVMWESITQSLPSKTIMIRANTNQNLKSKNLYVSRSCPKCVRKMEKGLLEISYKIPLWTAKCVAFLLLSVPSILLCQVWRKFPSGQACQERVILSPNPYSRVTVPCWTKKTVSAPGCHAPHPSLALPVAEVPFQAAQPRVLELVYKPHWAPCLWKGKERQAGKTGSASVCSLSIGLLFP